MNSLMTPTTDFEAIFRVSPYPYIVISKDFIIMSANDAYLRAVARTEEDIVGRHVFDAFPENPDDPNSTNTQELKDSINTAIASGKPHTTAFIRYAVPKETSEGTVFEERYWSTVHTPAYDEHGEVACVFQNTIDVTDFYNFDSSQQTASINLKPNPLEDQGQFSRAQMHQAMARILNDERGHLRNLFNQSPGFVAVLTGPDHVFEMVNEAYYQLIGHREVVGKPVWEALPEVVGQGYEEILDHVYTSGESWNARSIKVAIQRAPNTPMEDRYIDLAYQPYHDQDGSVIGIFSQGYDVTDTYAAQSAQKDIEERLKEGMLAAKMVVWDWNIASNRIIFSDNVMDVLGASVETTDALWEFIDEADFEKMKQLHQQAIVEKSGYQTVVKYTRPDNGVQIWLDIRGKIRCDATGEAFLVRGVTLDISERVAAEQELREADNRKDEFLAMLAHELRNPLAPISAAAEIMKLKTLDEKQLRQTGDIITRQIRHMTGLVDDLIDVSRVTRGLINIDKELLDVKTIIAEAVEQASPLIESKHQHLIVDLSAQNGEVWGDHKRLVQVVTNVLGNAAKYTPVGGNLMLKMLVKDGEVIIQVIDNGIGMAKELLPHVYELFTQAERTSDRSQGGLGIGLALVKSLVTLHEGTVTASSPGVGYGSTFTIQLPLASSTEEFPLSTEAIPNQAVPNQSMHSAMPASDDFTVMIVDDNVDAAETLGMFLEAMDYKVMLAYTAQTAIAQVKTKVPDVFILDIGLPDMDGNELARHFQAVQQTALTPLIALTGYGQEEDRLRTTASGFMHHLVKPVDAKALLAIIDALQQAKTERSS